MTLFCFTHSSLSGIQKGIQSLHAAVDLVQKYTGPRAQLVNTWARDHKTVVVLDGGSCVDLQAIVYLLALSHPYPWTSFSEDASLSNALTAVAILLPPWMAERPRPGSEFYEDLWRQWRAIHNPTDFDLKIVDLLNRSRKAV